MHHYKININDVTNLVRVRDLETYVIKILGLAFLGGVPAKKHLFRLGVTTDIYIFFT